MVVKNYFFKIVAIIFLLIQQGLLSQDVIGVTYETTSGRFGDNLLSFLHAKWVSYCSNVPLIYAPFIYSDQLSFSQKYQIQIPYNVKFRECTDPSLLQKAIKSKGPIIYKVLYFPESPYELAHGISFKGGAWDCFSVNWKDKQFIQSVMEDLTPKRVLNLIALPKDKITVAMHVRRGGNHDSRNTPSEFPLKFLPDSFFIKQLKRLYQILGEQPLYVFVFTDDNHPAQVVKKYSRYFAKYSIEFAYRTKNSDTENVLEDFFSMMQFDCMIHSESNFSLIPSLIGDYMVTIHPDSFTKMGGRIIYNHVVTEINHDKIASWIEGKEN